jgi:soluble lytic murein transglycosylase-like protein
MVLVCFYFLFLKTAPPKENNSLVKKLLIMIMTLFLIITNTITNLNREKLYEKEISKNRKLSKQLYKINSEKLKLKNIRKTLEIAYSLNRYESKYYSYIFKDLADEQNVPWELIASVVWIESKYNPSAHSIANCKGLMQLKDETARQMAEKADIDYYRNIVWNDMMNIVLGTHYLSSGYHEKGLEYSLKKYVGGPKVKKPGASKRYENWYKGRVKGVYIKLKYIYKGVSNNGRINEEASKRKKSE